MRQFGAWLRHVSSKSIRKLILNFIGTYFCPFEYILIASNIQSVRQDSDVACRNKNAASKMMSLSCVKQCRISTYAELAGLCSLTKEMPSVRYVLGTIHILPQQILRDFWPLPHLFQQYFNTVFQWISLKFDSPSPPPNCRRPKWMSPCWSECEWVRSKILLSYKFHLPNALWDICMIEYDCNCSIVSYPFLSF